MIGCVGDLVEDIGIKLAGPVNLATDTDVVLSRRRGGSAANTAVIAAGIEGRARFIGCVGADPLGDALIADLESCDVDVIAPRNGRTGTILLLLDHEGERTMLRDRGSSAELREPERVWLEGLDGLHVPFYSLAQAPLADTCRTLIGWAHELSISVSIDLSSTAVLGEFGHHRLRREMAELAPNTVFANEAEAALVGRDVIMSVIPADGEFVVHGPGNALVHHAGGTISVASLPLGALSDSTGAGDAFAAGYLVARLAGSEASESACAGHAAAHTHLTRS